MGCFSSKVHVAPGMRERLTVLVAVQFGADTDEGRSCLCAFVKNMGAKWDILLATSPEAAVHICKVRSVDIVIMSAVFDASSGLNGLEAARQIREAERSMCPTWIHAKPQNWLPVVIVMVEGVELSYSEVRGYAPPLKKFQNTHVFTGSREAAVDLTFDDATVSPSPNATL